MYLYHSHVGEYTFQLTWGNIRGKECREVIHEVRGIILRA
jgi:hypothetical protein